MSRRVRAEIEAATRKLLAERLEQCTPAQREVFGRVFPGGVPAAKLEEAIDLCDRTISKNQVSASEKPTVQP